MIIRK